MALPPTRLTVKLSQVALEPVELVDALDSHGLLSPIAVRDTSALSSLIRGIIADSEQSQHPGPTVHDRLARALIDNGMLNARGLEWATAPPFRRTILVWALTLYPGWMSLSTFVGLALILDGSYAFWFGATLVLFGVVSGFTARAVWRGSPSAPQNVRWMAATGAFLCLAAATYDARWPDLATGASMALSALAFWLTFTLLSRRLATTLGVAG